MKLLGENKIAKRDFEILEKILCGIELKGFEVKSIKLGKFSFKGSFARIKKGEVFLENFYIAPYQEKNVPPSYDPYRQRKLLLRKREIKSLVGKLHKKPFTLIPTKVYQKNGLIKIEIALCRKKKKYEKKEELKKKEIEREIQRYLKEY